jgi:hypothetical protein
MSRPDASPAYDAAADGKFADNDGSMADWLRDLREAQWLSTRLHSADAPLAARRGGRPGLTWN